MRAGRGSAGGRGPPPADSAPHERRHAERRDGQRQHRGAGRQQAQAREAHAASDLIATLAGQNARLIEAVEQVRLRLRLLSVGAAVLALAIVALGALAFVGR